MITAPQTSAPDAAASAGIPTSVEQGARSAEIIEMVPLVLGIRHILVPVDFSEPSEKALHYAASFARQFDAKISLLYVRPVPYFPAGMGEFAMPLPPDEPPLEQINARLQSDARRLLPPDMCERTDVRMGPAYDEICAAAKEFAVDLIIIATHGRTGLKRALLGSTAERVVRHASCPVLVVREREHEFA